MQIQLGAVDHFDSMYYKQEKEADRAKKNYSKIVMIHGKK